jgi:hypothetical protein
MIIHRYFENPHTCSTEEYQVFADGMETSKEFLKKYDSDRHEYQM